MEQKEWAALSTKGLLPQESTSFHNVKEKVVLMECDQSLGKHSFELVVHRRKMWLSNCPPAVFQGLATPSAFDERKNSGASGLLPCQVNGAARILKLTETAARVWQSGTQHCRREHGSESAERLVLLV